MVETANIIWADGPLTTPAQPDKAQIRTWGTWVESSINAFLASGGKVYATRAALYADLSQTANTMAWVVGDPTAAFNGIYQKIGASNSGSWTRRGDLPYSFIAAFNTGTGTANDIEATTSIPISESALVLINFTAANTGPMTVSFNGGSPLSLKSNSGNNIAPNGVVPDMLALGRKSGSTFRLVTDQISAAIVAQAEDAADRAEAAAAGLTLPSITIADAGKVLVVNDLGSGYDLSTKVLKFEQLMRFHASLALETAERGAVVMAGPDGNGFFDGFNALTYVNVGGAVNLDTSTAGELKGTTSTATVTSGGSPAGSTDYTALTMIDRTFTLTNGRTVTKLGVYSTIARTFTMKILQRTGTAIYSVAYSQAFAHPGGGWADLTLATPFDTPASGTYYVGSYYATGMIEFNTGRNRAFATGDVSGSGITFTEQAAQSAPAHRAVEITGANNFTVESQPLVLTSAPEWGFLVAFVDLNDAILNTDLSFNISRNGSAYGAVSMTQNFTRLGDSIAIMSAIVNLSSIASGTSGKWKITSQNSKRPIVQAVGITFGVYAA